MALDQAGAPRFYMAPMAVALRQLAVVLGATALLTACPRAGEEELRKANVYFSTGDLDRALTLYTTAAELDPKSSRAREGAANVHYERGELAEAKRWYQLAIAANENAVTPRHKLALTLAAGGELEPAVAALRGALEVAPDNPYALSTIGGLYRRMDRLEDAEKMQLEALRLDPDYHGARYALANVMIDSGRITDAEEQLTRLATSGRGALAEYGFARIAARAGDAAEAARRLNDLLDGGVDAPARIADDPAFSALWTTPQMAAVRRRLGVKTSTTTN